MYDTIHSGVFEPSRSPGEDAFLADLQDVKAQVRDFEDGLKRGVTVGDREQLAQACDRIRKLALQYDHSLNSVPFVDTDDHGEFNCDVLLDHASKL